MDLKWNSMLWLPASLHGLFVHERVVEADAEGGVSRSLTLRTTYQLISSASSSSLSLVFLSGYLTLHAGNYALHRILRCSYHKTNSVTANNGYGVKLGIHLQLHRRLFVDERAVAIDTKSGVRLSLTLWTC